MAIRTYKKYPNRRLYETTPGNTPGYRTQQDLFGAIREGYQVEIRTHPPGEDVTHQVIAQALAAHDELPEVLLLLELHRLVRRLSHD